MRGLGAEVRCLELWHEPGPILPRAGEVLRTLFVEAPDRPDIATGVLRMLRREPALAAVAAMAAVSVAQVARLDPGSGFDDFVLFPYVPAELYARMRALEWRKSEFANEERMKVGAILIDRAGREVSVDGQPVPLTAREFALLAYLCDRRGRVVSRDEALAKVWGRGYEGGARTVDIHVRRLRQKLGDALALETSRGAGYKVAAPAGVVPAPGARAVGVEA
ncbi:MAG: response regulator transcription factor [Polyangiaceae bacterium]|nr:response regulator transcription factor [Polyangiaceae bacterium]